MFLHSFCMNQQVSMCTGFLFVCCFLSQFNILFVGQISAWKKLRNFLKKVVWLFAYIIFNAQSSLNTRTPTTLLLWLIKKTLNKTLFFAPSPGRVYWKTKSAVPPPLDSPHHLHLNKVEEPFRRIIYAKKSSYSFFKT